MIHGWGAIPNQRTGSPLLQPHHHSPASIAGWSTETRSRCSISAPWPWTGAALDGTLRHSDSLLTCGNDTSRHEPDRRDMIRFGLLIRGFGVRVPGGAPGARPWPAGLRQERSF